ncbi:hypothetical protein [Sinanaerobacter sp. ZZT-01]|uniref:hypothetical protein n=1 Tax=Sinanaerobacter sp. ZZT-01 TaxID=3111540 RepID=UPI002D775FBA|nr:hypothetical protein [Sinanaerobacter sp. ZZT-01]WRR94119.1 hypothetical protein U5921_03090 [Sinanaerobacter sp. ZZT-01]
MKYLKKKVIQNCMKRLGSAILCMGIIFAGILLSSCQCKTLSISPDNVEASNVIVEYERHEDLNGIYRIDIVIPKVDAAGEAAKTLNETIHSEFMDYYRLNAENANEILGGWKYPQINISYKVIRLEQMCAISVITEIHSEEDQGKELSVRNYYYDEIEKEILSMEEYLKKVGLTAEDITQAFISGIGRDYHLEQVEFSSLQNHFYINGEKEPVFCVSD